MEKAHVVRDIVEGQDACLVIHIHSHSTRAGRRVWVECGCRFRGGGGCGYLDLCVIVLEHILGGRAAEVPRVTAGAELGVVPSPFPADSFVGDGQSHPTLPAPLHLPIAAAGYALLAEHLCRVQEPFWVVRVGLDLYGVRSLLASLRQTETIVGSVEIHCETAAVYCRMGNNT